MTLTPEQIEELERRWGAYDAVHGRNALPEALPLWIAVTDHIPTLLQSARDLRAVAVAWEKAKAADLAFQEYCERADGEGWANDPTGSSWINDARNEANKADAELEAVMEAVITGTALKRGEP